MGDGISSSAWSRSTSKPEKPTQGAPARAGCPTPAAKSAPSGAHSAQITQVCEWRTRPIAWPSRRRNRFLNSGLRFLTLDARPPRARTLPKPQINFHSRLERRFQNAKTSPIRPEKHWNECAALGLASSARSRRLGQRGARASSGNFEGWRHGARALAASISGPTGAATGLASCGRGQARCQRVVAGEGMGRCRR